MNEATVAASTTMEQLFREAQVGLAPELINRLRVDLAGKSHDWLVDELIRSWVGRELTDAAADAERTAAAQRYRAAQLERVATLRLDSTRLSDFIERFRTFDREQLVREEYLLPAAPAPGTALIDSHYRTTSGERLLTHAKDVLWALLFGNDATSTTLRRTHRELLTFALPRHKAHVLGFMQAATELSATGTWRDPSGVSNDSSAPNSIVEVEYGETQDELVGDGIVRCLALINSLEVNEQILYARMIDIEQSTLVA